MKPIIGSLDSHKIEITLSLNCLNKLFRVLIMNTLKSTNILV